MDRYSFDVELSHLLLHAGLSRRSASPVPTTTFCTFHFPRRPRGFFDTRSRFPGVFRGLRPSHTGSAPSNSCSRRIYFYDAFRIRFMLRTAHLIHPASTLTSLSNPEASLPRTLASPWTGLAPVSYRELVARSMSYLTSLFAVTYVRASGRTWDRIAEIRSRWLKAVP